MTSLPRDEVAALNPNHNPTHAFTHTSFTPPSSKSSTKSSAKSHSMKDNKKRPRESASREATPTMTSKGDVQPDVFEQHLIRIRTSVTCTICVQLLYEPFTLGCGHTYCYGCLCSWFHGKKNGKTCPNCRAHVKQMPTQNYLVKDIVEGFTKQPAIMPADESVEQHKIKREKEAAEIEEDKKSDKGLFKGMFPKKPTGGRLWFDEADGVMRCPTCAHEHEGGPVCTTCGEQFNGDPYDYSDYDDDEDEGLDNIEVDLDVEEVEIDFAHAHMRNHHRFMDRPHFVGAHAHGAHYPHHFHHPAILSEASELSGSDDSEPTGDSDDESDSLDGFVVRDEEPIREPIRGVNGRVVDLSSPEPALPRQRQEINLVSDDESDDEGGAISNGRTRRRRRMPGAFVSSSPPPPAVPDALSISDDSTHESDYDETLSEAEQRLQSAGWSPLDNGNESEIEAREPYDYEYGGYTTNEDEHEDQRSDTTTETIDGNAAMYHGDEDESQRDLSETPHSQTPTYNNDGYGRAPNSYLDYGAFDAYGSEYYQHLSEDDDDEGTNEYSIAEGASIDGDGDTEMTVSSRERDRSRSNTRDVSAARVMTYAADYNEDYEARDRGVSVTDDGHPDDESDYGYGMPTSNTYVANAMPEGEEDSSDSSIRPPVRRQPRQPRQYVQPARDNVHIFHHSNPFIPEPHTRQGSRASSVYIEVASRGGGSRRDPIQIDGAVDDREDDLRNWGELRRFMEPATRDRRMTAYRSMPVRRVDLLRSSRSPSATRVVSSSSRASRVPRHYQRRS